MATVTGTVVAPTENRAHTLLMGSVDGGSITAGETHEFDLGSVTNMGNVNQTVTVSEITNATNCSFVGSRFVVGETSTTGSVELAPNEVAEVWVSVSFPSEAIGSADQSFSFEVDPVWS